MRNHIKVGTAIAGALCLLPLLAQAGILKCEGAAGSVTYTNGQCAPNMQVHVIILGAGNDDDGTPPDEPAADEPANTQGLHASAWARPIKVVNHHPDVEVIKAAKRKLQMMDEQRLRRRMTHLAQYRED